MNRIAPRILSQTRRFISAAMAQLALCLLVAPMLIAQKAQAQREREVAGQSTPQPAERVTLDGELDAMNLRPEEASDAGSQNAKRRSHSGKSKQRGNAKVWTMTRRSFAAVPPMRASYGAAMGKLPMPQKASASPFSPIPAHKCVAESASGFMGDEVRCRVTRLRDGNPATQPIGPPAC